MKSSFSPRGLTPGRRVIIKRFKNRPGFWNQVGEMDCWMGQVLTVGHVDNQQEVWHAEECEWVWRFADIECFADESNDPNLAYRIRKAETP